MTHHSHETYPSAHHILHYKQEWRLRPEAKAIREHRSLIPVIPRDVHNALHDVCPPVPLLGYHALKRVTREWYPAHDTLQSMDNLMIAMDSAAKHERSHEIESALAELAIQAIDLQRPFIADALGTPERVLRVV